MGGGDLRLYAQVLAGGTGTRLWPCSRRGRPKQFLSLAGEDTMLQATVRRLQPLIPPERVLVLTNAEYVDEVRRQLPEVADKHIIGEPDARGTAPAAGLGAALAMAEDPEATLVLLPADHVISPPEELHDCLARAAAAASEDWLVTFGLKPTYAATGYGYVELGAELPGESGAHQVARFVEKPTQDEADEYVAGGRHYWNSGMFAWKVGTFFDECSRLLPRLFLQLQEIVDLARSGDGVDSPHGSRRIAEIWSHVEDRTTIDYGIMERSDRVACIPTSMQWSDVGSWAALEDLLPADGSGNVVVGDSVRLDSSDCIIYGCNDRLVATLGVDDLVIVDTPDAVLVCRRDRAQDVKELVEALRHAGREELL